MSAGLGLQAFLSLSLMLVSSIGTAQQPHQQEIQRALIELDRRAAGVHEPLEPHVGRPLHPDPTIARELQPYERLKEREKAQRALRPAPPVERPEGPLPLPGGPQAGVDPVTVPGRPN